MNSKFTYYFLIIAVSLGISCSDDTNNFEPTESEYIEIPDIQFETKLINYGIDTDGVINQKLLKSDAASVDYLNLTSQSSLDEISDLTGIEGFVKLKSLYAVGNKLSTVDLSKNKLLDTLNLEGNNLTTIDLSNNSKLLMLDLKVNDLTSISGLSAATNLKWLNLSFNLFEDYTIENPSLVNILMSHNELVSFDTSNAINLESIYIITNKITELDLSANILLEVMDVGNNKLTDINFGQKDKLSYLSCFSNYLTELDVSNFEKLSYLSPNRNPNLLCVKIKSGQTIPTLKLSDYQQISANCN